MMHLPAKDAASLSKIAGMLESDHDGEALSAARMLVRRLGAHGLHVADVIEYGLGRANVVGLSCDVSSEAYSYEIRPRPATAFPSHWVKIDALLDDTAFMGEVLTRRSVDRLQSLRMAAHLSPENYAWVDGLLDQARDLHARRAA